MFCASRKGACTRADQGPPGLQLAPRLPQGSVHPRRPRASGPPTGAAPPRKGSVHLRRSARKSACRRRASPQGECAPAPVRPKERVPVPRLPQGSVHPRRPRASGPPTGAAPPVRGACTCAGPPERACTGAAPPREGSVHLRRTTRQSVYRCRASPRGERAPAPDHPTERVPARASPQGECATASARPLPGAGRRTRNKGAVRPKRAATGVAPPSAAVIWCGCGRLLGLSRS